MTTAGQAEDSGRRQRRNHLGYEPITGGWPTRCGAAWTPPSTSTSSSASSSSSTSPTLSRRDYAQLETERDLDADPEDPDAYRGLEPLLGPARKRDGRA